MKNDTFIAINYIMHVRQIITTNYKTNTIRMAYTIVPIQPDTTKIYRAHMSFPVYRFHT